MRKFLSALLFVFGCVIGAAQTTAVMATVVDPDSTAWANANWFLAFQPSQSQPNFSAYQIGGSPLSQATAYQQGTANGSGVITFTTYQTPAIVPIGSQWKLTICPLASVSCSVLFFSTSGSSQDISSTINALIQAPRFHAIAGAIGYNDTEAQVQLTVGNTYWNVTSSAQRCYTGSAWQVCATGSTVNLTTTGTTGASTYSGGTLNIPVYQGQLTLTTTGSSGASTLSGNTLNIPQYAGTTVNVNGSAVSNPNFNNTTPTAASGYVNGTFQSSGSNVSVSVPSIFNNASTQIHFISYSGTVDDSNQLSTAVPVSTWACTGSTGNLTCTVNTTSAHGLTAGFSYVDASTLTGWPTRTSPYSRQDTNYGSFLVQTTPTGSQLTFTDTNSIDSAMSGTGGNIYDASYWAIYKLAHGPYFWQHGIFSDFVISAQSANTNFSTLIPSCNVGDIVWFVTGPDDYVNGRTFTQYTGDMQSLWQKAHNAGCIVWQDTSPNAAWGLTLTSTVSALSAEVNQWYPSQAPSQGCLGSGGNKECWDHIAQLDSYWWDFDAQQTNGTILGSSTGGADAFANMNNAAFSNQRGSLAVAPLWQWWGTTTGDYSAAIPPGAAKNVYLYDINGTLDLQWNLSGGGGSAFRPSLISYNNMSLGLGPAATHFDLAPSLPTGQFLCNVIGVGSYAGSLSMTSNNGFFGCYSHVTSGSTNNYFGFGPYAGSSKPSTKSDYNIIFGADKSVAVPGIAAGSGNNCVQVDTNGKFTNTGTPCGSGSGSIGGSGTTNYYALFTASTTLGNGHLDDGQTTAGVNTSSEPFTVNATSVATQETLTYSTGHAPAGTAGSAVIAPDTSGNLDVSENNGTLYRVCTSGNSQCPPTPYPGAGVANSTGSAWGTSYSVGGSGAGLTSGPISGVTTNDAAKFTGTGGQIADSGLVMPSAAGSATVAQLIANGTAAMGTSAISSGTCASVVTVSATGVATTDVIVYTPNADPTGVTGYAPSASGSLYIWAYPTSGNVNFKVCNNTSGSITPSALTLNWRVAR